MLLARIFGLVPQEAVPKQEGHSPRYVTREQLEEQLAEFEKRTQWVLDEWYEKFSTLHARAEKARQRAGKSGRQEQPDPQVRAPNGHSEQPTLSVLHFRKPWSV